MNDTRSSVLPYRVDAADLARYLGARARGRDNNQVQAALNLSAKGLEGILSAATTLGFLDAASGALSDRGRQFALASSDDVRRKLVEEGMLSFEPYELLFEALLQRDDRVTTLDWIETWWNTHGYGSSASNRTEGASAFGRLSEFAGLGSYIQGRRGHASRIEWTDGALARLSSDGNDPSQPQDEPPPATSAEDSQAGRSVQPSSPARSSDVQPDAISLNLPLGPGRVVEIRLPAQISAAEKDRLLQLLEVLIAPAIQTSSVDSET